MKQTKTYTVLRIGAPQYVFVKYFISYLQRPWCGTGVSEWRTTSDWLDIFIMQNIIIKIMGWEGIAE